MFKLNENQIFYLYSTSSQVLAGIYGLTLTGFIFLRNELSREEIEDDTLSQVIQKLKKRYFVLLLYITFLSIFSLFMSNIVISLEKGTPKLLNTILMNVTQSSFIISLITISYFIFDITSPDKIKKESEIIQKDVDPISEKDEEGNLESFLRNFNQLESIIQKYGQFYQSEINSNSINRRRISNVRLIEFILKAEKIDYDLFYEIKNLISLRNSIVHGAQPKVSKRIVDESERVLKKLSEKLAVS
ncbi:hypothetical protein [Aliarcobacter butzleri]|uniref:hypothetical protein n=2 Tax=Aliarcobacter butzleri TaxID=28197 RepID=UPI002B24AB74|nr:hypothetical protein [Aliarcobacter butzleri]